MLEAIVLKVRHTGMQEARKLLPHILSCDVFGPEYACLTEESARSVEGLWDGVLATGMSRSRLKRLLEEMEPVAKLPADQVAYSNQMFEYLFRNRKPIYHLERFSLQESLALNAKFAEVTLARREAAALVRAGRVEEGVARWHAATREEIAMNDVRDEHMAQQLLCAEERLRERYPQLGETIHFPFIVGSMHRPEAYAEVPVVSLIGDCPPQEMLALELEAKVRSGYPVEELVPLYRELAPFVSIDAAIPSNKP